MYKKRINGNFITEKIIKINTILDEFKSKQTQMRRGSVNWKIYQKKISKLKHRDKRVENIERVCHIVGIVKRFGILVIEVPKEYRKRENETEAISEQIRARNFPKLMKDINSPIQEALQDPKQYKYKESHTQLIIVKLLKTKE